MISLPTKIISEDKLFHSLSSLTETSNFAAISESVSTASISYVSVFTVFSFLSSFFVYLIAMVMDAAAIALVSYQYNIPFIIVRALSDIAGKDAPMSFNHFVDIASKNAARFIMEMLDNM